MINGGCDKITLKEKEKSNTMLVQLAVILSSQIVASIVCFPQMFLFVKQWPFQRDRREKSTNEL